MYINVLWIGIGRQYMYIVYPSDQHRDIYRVIFVWVADRLPLRSRYRIEDIYMYSTNHSAQNPCSTNQNAWKQHLHRTAPSPDELHVLPTHAKTTLYQYQIFA